jgi:hypothetical protein
MLDPDDVKPLLEKDKRFLKLSIVDQKFVVDMTIGKIEEFIVNLDPEEKDDD